MARVETAVTVAVVTVRRLHENYVVMFSYTLLFIVMLV